MSQRILVVEDSRTVRRVVERTLSQAGFAVDLAHDGRDGLDRLRDHVPDLILLDFVMPHLNGLQFAQALRAVDNVRDVPVVLMSARAEKIAERFMEQTGAIDALNKPFSPEALLAVVTHALARAEESKQRLEATTSVGAVSAQVVASKPARTHSVSGLLAPDALEDAEEQKQAVAEQLLLRIVDALLPFAERAGMQWDRSAFVAALLSRHDPESMFALVSELSTIARAAPSQVGIEGAIEHVPLGDVLQLLQQERQTGTLEVFDALGTSTRTISICLSEGKVDLAVGRVGEAEFLISRYLLEERLVDEESLAAALKSSQSNRMLLGTHLVKQGVITADELRDVLIRQSSELIYEALRWKRGRYRFVRLMIRPEANAARLALSMESILMEGLRRVDEWRLIEEALDSFDTVLRQDLEASRTVDIDRLQPDERTIYKMIDGTRSVRSIAAATRMNSFDIGKIVFQLLTARLVRRV